MQNDIGTLGVAVSAGFNREVDPICQEAFIDFPVTVVVQAVANFVDWFWCIAGGQALFKTDPDSIAGLVEAGRLRPLSDGPIGACAGFVILNAETAGRVFDALTGVFLGA
jgi:hypothetical protein